MVRITVGSTGALVILVYGADPDRGEPCVLNVVEVLPDSFPGPATPTENEDLNKGRRR